MIQRKRRLFLVITLLVFLPIFSGSAIRLDRATKDETYKELSLFADCLAIIQSQYVEVNEPKDLIYGALKGMLNIFNASIRFSRT